MKRKGGRKRKNKVAQRKRGKSDQQMRTAFETQASSRHAKPAANHA